ncbi:hypothetical protein HPB49_024168 [Dermacentor silvarum]|uniref:Uncharacterized protein n=1 Tax=Dermacentor silvarum TaxID=543639 RepID=A0ACB8D8U2_DERSI|nr:hypothetical protein HPB49_024168 [Dermacentor silvarum]
MLFRTPYIVKKRQWEAKLAAEPEEEKAPKTALQQQQVRCSRHDGARERSKSTPRDRSASFPRLTPSTREEASSRPERQSKSSQKGAPTELTGGLGEQGLSGFRNECGKNTKLASYKSYAGRWDNTQVVTLVKRSVTVLQHETGSMQMDHVLIELVPRKRKDKNLFVLDVYSSPRQRNNCGFDDLFAKVKMIAKGSPLLVVGDFNAHHPAWGYRFAQVKGNDLCDSIQHNGLTVSQDTTPDLTLVGGRISATWCNTGEDLGSDHRIIEIVIEDVPSVARTKKLEL